MSAAFLALSGLTLAVIAGLRTETEDIRRRAAIGGLGLLFLALGIGLL